MRPSSLAEFRPAVVTAHEIARRLWEKDGQDQAKEHCKCAAREEQSAPAEGWQDVTGEDPRQHATEGNADDRGGDRHGPTACRRELGGHRGRAGKSAPDAQAGKEAQYPNHQEALREADGNGGQAEEKDAADDGRSPTEAVREQAGTGAADAHPDEPNRERKCEVAAANAPFLDQHVYREADELAVEAIHNDGERGEEADDLLHRRPRAGIEDLPDVGGAARRGGGTHTDNRGLEAEASGMRASCARTWTVDATITLSSPPVSCPAPEPDRIAAFCPHQAWPFASGDRHRQYSCGTEDQGQR